MILIADSGSTKTSWALLHNKNIDYISSEGYNPYYMDTAYIEKSIICEFTDVRIREKITQVHFYGAGCSLEKKPLVYKALKTCFVNATIAVESDLLAAARCLLGSKSGFAAILGTGTNTCFYNGENIVETVDSLGFLIGDEGSGAYIGKQLIKAYVRGYLPEELKKLFIDTYGISAEDIITDLYASNLPNRYAAQYAIFVSQHIHHEFMQNLVKSSFRNFFSEIVSNYKDHKGMEINFVGSIGFAFKNILSFVASEYEMLLGRVVKEPLSHLITYHYSLIKNT